MGGEGNWEQLRGQLYLGIHYAKVSHHLTRAEQTNG